MPYALTNAQTVAIINFYVSSHFSIFNEFLKKYKFLNRGVRDASWTPAVGEMGRRGRLLVVKELT